jgi:FixJ family two-component response regulator
MRNKDHNEREREIVICADDDPTLRVFYNRVIGRYCDERNYKLEMLSSGEELEARLNNPSLNDLHDIVAVLTDNSMPPGPSGIKIIRKYSGLSGAPPFILSSGDFIDEESLEKAGVTTFLKKPVRYKDMIDAIDSAISERLV